MCIDDDMNRIGCTDNIKALGMRFLSRSNMDAHVDHVKKSFRSRYSMFFCKGALFRGKGGPPVLE